MSYLDRLHHLAGSAPKRGKIWLVGAGPGVADLLTLRAIRTLQTADVVFYDRLVDPEVLAFANPVAKRVFVGKEVGAHSWPQSRIDAAIVAAALQGQCVVRLKSGDPSIFGRAAEEITAAQTHGIEVEVVAGVTAASAAAASLLHPLTQRGQTDRVVLATATCREGDVISDLSGIATAGTTLVFYMAMQKLQALAGQLLAAGVDAEQPVTVAANASRPEAKTLHSCVGLMAADCAAAGVANPAVVIMSLHKRETDQHTWKSPSLALIK